MSNVNTQKAIVADPRDVFAPLQACNEIGHIWLRGYRPVHGITRDVFMLAEQVRIYIEEVNREIGDVYFFDGKCVWYNDTDTEGKPIVELASHRYVGTDEITGETLELWNVGLGFCTEDLGKKTNTTGAWSYENFNSGLGEYNHVTTPFENYMSWLEVFKGEETDPRMSNWQNDMLTHAYNAMVQYQPEALMYRPTID